MRILFFIFFFGMVSSGISQEDKANTPQTAMRVALGESTEVEGTEITFAEVLEDSRCPSSIDCIRRGRIKAKVEVIEDGADPVYKVVIFGDILPDETAENTLLETSEYTLEATGISPYPQLSGEQLEYHLLLKKKDIED